MLNPKKTLKKLTLFVFALALLPISSASAVDGGITVSPPYQMMVLYPGETISSTILIANPNSSASDISYKLTVAPFGVTSDTDYTIDYQTITERNDIMNWITFEWKEGTISPNESVQVPFTIKVPKDAPSGGQYASIDVIKVSEKSDSKEGVSIMEDTAISSLIYATVTGETKETGEILENKIPAFFFSGPLKTSTLIKNTGNVHQTVTYTLQVFPLFSDEEVFTNEEKPKKATVIPGTKLQNEIFWEESPTLGVFRVRQTINFNGKESIEEGIVFLCPKWFFMAVLIFALLCIFWIVYRIIVRRKIQKRSKNDVNFQAN